MWEARVSKFFLLSIHIKLFLGGGGVEGACY